MNKQCHEELMLNVAALSSHISGVNFILRWCFLCSTGLGTLGSQIFQLKCITLSSYSSFTPETDSLTHF